MKRFFCLLLLVSGLGRGSLWALSTDFDYQLDAYYSALDFYVPLTTRPIPTAESQSEWEIYRELLQSSPIPRFLLLEASFNPLPTAGTYIRRQAPGFYEDMEVTEDLNLVRALTAGFEEPWAVSLFLGNVIKFQPSASKKYGQGKGYMGYLLSAGNKHIKDNEMISDDWIEAEWKIRGDRLKPEIELRWSFRLGAKFHGNSQIADVYYVGIRRSRTDFEGASHLWWHNSGIMYKFDFAADDLRSVQHHLVVEKKFPLKESKLVPKLEVGFLLRGRNKYTGDLHLESAREFQFLFRPNLQF